MTTGFQVQTMREVFGATVTELLERDPRLVVVLADISAAMLAPAAERHPDRVVNVGIREQLLISTASGLAMTGLRPVVHTFSSFLVERPFEQIKLDLNHQDVGAVLVSAGASYDMSDGGRSHQSPGDVALLDTLPGWTVYVPGHPDEADRLLRTAVAGDDGVGSCWRWGRCWIGCWLPRSRSTWLSRTRRQCVRWTGTGCGRPCWRRIGRMWLSLSRISPGRRRIW